MPIAESFNALGAGNGFPYCLPKVDMTDLDGDGSGITANLWTTLGGTQKGSLPTQSEISLSLENAMKIYWNLYSVGTEEGILTLDTLQGNPFEPVDRACREFGWSKGIFVVSAFGFPLRMYDGDIEDEDNFVGYGVSRLALASKSVSGAPNIKFNFTSWTAAENSSTSEAEYNDSFAELPLVARCISQFDAKITISGLVASIDPDDAGLDPISLPYSNIDFYTY